MKKLSFSESFLIFFLVLVILFWMMPNTKIDTIGGFFEKVLTPIAYPLSAFIMIVVFGKYIKKINKIFNGENKKTKKHS